MNGSHTMCGFPFDCIGDVFGCVRFYFRGHQGRSHGKDVGIIVECEEDLISPEGHTIDLVAPVVHSDGERRNIQESPWALHAYLHGRKRFGMTQHNLVASLS
jgi:hypothetical protein